jgi:phosphoribosylformylglycinamidine (FGAM) synthase-like enzyme
MCFGEGSAGAEVAIPCGKGERVEEALFGEGGGRILLEVDEEGVTRVEELAKEAGVGCYRIGKSGGANLQISCGAVREEWSVQVLCKLYQEALPQALVG